MSHSVRHFRPPFLKSMPEPALTRLAGSFAPSLIPTLAVVGASLEVLS